VQAADSRLGVLLPQLRGNIHERLDELVGGGFH
jgi:hypothetical protein